MIFNILLLISLIIGCIAKKFVLLPYNSDLCKNNTIGIHKYYEFIISQQINLITDANLSDVANVMRLFSLPRAQIDVDNYQYFLCRTLVQPMGRPQEVHIEMGEYSFWNVRIQIDRVPGPLLCNDYLLLQFRHKENLITTLEGHSIKVMNITCRDKLPIIVQSDLRKLYITYFSSDRNSPGYITNVTSFVYFQGNFSSQYKQDLCRQQDGFWCVNTTTCVFRDMRCDGSDSCFDGGSDESGCDVINNITLPRNGDKGRKATSRFIDYLPWLALGILPLILLLALICICNQHRSEVYFDEEEDNLDVEKSHDGDDMWSNDDGLETKMNNDVMMMKEDDRELEDGVSEQCEWRPKNQYPTDCAISLVPLSHPESTITTTKADISASRTLQSINRDYEDIDQPGTSSACNNDVLPTKTIDITNNECEMREERSNIIMSMSQMTDDDYEDHLEDVGSLLRKVDKSKIPDEVRITAHRSPSTANNNNSPCTDNLNQASTRDTGGDDSTATLEYRSDYILV